jgi:hypothetical protein
MSIPVPPGRVAADGTQTVVSDPILTARRAAAKATGSVLLGASALRFADPIPHSEFRIPH